MATLAPSTPAIAASTTLDTTIPALATTTTPAFACFAAKCSTADTKPRSSDARASLALAAPKASFSQPNTPPAAAAAAGAPAHTCVGRLLLLRQ